MLYDTGSLLKIWSEFANLKIIPGNYAHELGYFDIYYGTVMCPVCHKYVNLLHRHAGRWGCQTCQKTQTLNRQMYPFFITNTIIDYLGPFELDRLLEEAVIKQICKFCAIDKQPTVYLMFIKFIRRLLDEECRNYDILAKLPSTALDIRGIGSGA